MSPAPMTREAAFFKASKELGDGALVGFNIQRPAAPYYVGVRAKGLWMKYGEGMTWEEAFASVREVIRQTGDWKFVFKDVG